MKSFDGRITQKVNQVSGSLEDAFEECATAAGTANIVGRKTSRATDENLVVPIIFVSKGGW